MTIRVTRKTVRLLRILLNLHGEREYAAKAAKHASFDLSSRAMMREARLSPTAFYDLIGHLQRIEWVEAEREEVPADENRAPHTFYHLTEEGVTHAHYILQKRDARFWNKIRRR